MSLFDTIQSDMYAAMKSGDKHKTGTLRVALSTLKDKKIEKREDLTDVEAIKIIQNLVNSVKRRPISTRKTAVMISWKMKMLN